MRDQRDGQVRRIREAVDVLVGRGDTTFISRVMTPNSFFSILLIAFLLIASISPIAAAQNSNQDILELVVRPNKKAGEPISNLFKNQVLSLVLEKTKAKYGDFKITEYENPISQSGVLSLINKGKIFRVTATMASVKREKLARPVRIPIYKGLLGHRVFIIRPEDQYKFSSIENNVGM